jgi:hypothetical protein
MFNLVCLGISLATAVLSHFHAIAAMIPITIHPGFSPFQIVPDMRYKL